MHTIIINVCLCLSVTNYEKSVSQFTVLTAHIFSFLSLSFFIFFLFLLGYKGANSSRFQRCSVGGETPSGL